MDGRVRRITLTQLRRYAVARTLFPLTTLVRAIDRLGFVQADPIRAPARAQDLTLRHRVKDYVAGDLERRYPRLPVEEDCLVNYGFLPRRVMPLLHPRTARKAWDATSRRRAAEILAFVRERGEAHPRDVQRAFAHGKVRGYWGQALSATTHLLDGMHYRGMLRVVRRDQGTRVYGIAEHQAVEDSAQTRLARAHALLSLIVTKYAPLPSASLGYLAQLLRYGAPHLLPEVRVALKEARQVLPQAQVDGVTWFWQPGEDPAARRWALAGRVRLLAPFDPVVWDRRRFELLWGWAYRFEAYTPAVRRKLGHYALPLLWEDQVVGWANLTIQGSRLQAGLGFHATRPTTPAFSAALEGELHDMERFLQL